MQRVTLITAHIGFNPSDGATSRFSLIKPLFGYLTSNG